MRVNRGGAGTSTDAKGRPEMAQTSTRKSSPSGGKRRSSGSTRASTSSRGSSSKRQSRSPRTSASPGKRSSASWSSGSDSVISSAAGKVKWPAVAGGAALAGLAGGVALGAKRYSGRKVLGMRVGNGSGGAGKNLAEASKNVGRFSENVGQFAAEIRKTREAIENGSKHSSPIEV